MEGKMEKEKILKNDQDQDVAISNIDDISLRRHYLVEKLIGKANKIKKVLNDYKEECDKEVDKYLKFLERKKKTKFDGWKGNLLLNSFDGKMRIVKNINDIISFDETLKLAKMKIDECLKNWSNDNDNIKAIVTNAFNVDKKGRVNVGMILRLKKIKIDDKEWNEAIKIIDDSIKINSTREYYKFQVKDNKNQWESIDLNFSKL